MSSREAEAVVEEQAEVFERFKPYLVDNWRNGHPPERLQETLGNHG
jgi:hypothetical protein